MECINCNITFDLAFPLSLCGKVNSPSRLRQDTVVMHSILPTMDHLNGQVDKMSASNVKGSGSNLDQITTETERLVL